ncbi:MAG: hypothetical protein ABIW85_07710, partial [Variovorax sp.]
MAAESASSSVAGINPADGRPMRVDVQDGKVQAVYLECSGPRHDADPGWLAPGLIDLQVNGYGGHDVNGE